MGTRALGSRPWLVADEQRSAEMGLKAALSAHRHEEVFQAMAGTGDAGRETLELVTGELGIALPGDTADLHPLDAAGRLVQEDLCLLSTSPTGWLLVAGAVWFPSRWRLADKMGLPLLDVHAPVEGYRQDLARRVDTLFDRLEDRIVRRRNWFVRSDPRLFQPDGLGGAAPVVAAPHCLGDLYLRSERQTLRRLPRSGLVLFTIRTQQLPLQYLLDDAARREAFINFVDRASPQLAERHGLSPGQRAEIKVALAPGPKGRPKGVDDPVM